MYALEKSCKNLYTKLFLALISDTKVMADIFLLVISFQIFYNKHKLLFINIKVTKTRASLCCRKKIR